MRILGNRIAIETIQPEPSSQIELPENMQPKPDRGIVVAIGSGSKVPKELAVGKVIHFDNRYGCQDVIERGRRLKIISTEDVLAVFK